MKTKRNKTKNMIATTLKKKTHDFGGTGKFYETYYALSNGMRHGQYICFHENGNVVDKLYFVNGNRDGVHESSYASGRMSIVQTNKNGRLHGIDIEFNYI